MSRFTRLGTAVLLGVAASYGARYLVRRLDLSPHIDWEQARRLALRVSKWEEAPVVNRTAREAQYLELVSRSEPLIAERLGVRLPQPVTRVEVVDRREWLETNFESLAVTFAPFEDLLVQLRARQEPFSSLLMSGRVAGAQIGVLLGFLSRRVLGQYDLGLLSPDPERQGVLYFVEPNIASVQAQLGLRDEDFRLWIALHEVAHVFQFEAYPWVRGYFNGLLRRLLKVLADQLASPGAGLPGFLERLVRNPFSGRHWIERALTPEGQRLFDSIQALMSLSEGYANYMMKSIGQDLLPSFEEIERQIRQRERNKPLLLELFDRLTGMDLKLAQYKQGEAFVAAVARARGLEFVNRAWEKPENLPTRTEIRQPGHWIARMDG